MASLSLIPAPQQPAVEVLDPDPIALRPVQGRAEFIAALREAVLGPAPAAIPDEDKPMLWATAFNDWLSRSPRTGHDRPAATIRAYTAAWKDFRLFTGDKAPWRITPGDVRTWLDDLRNRIVHPTVARGLETNGRREPGQLGLSEGTIGQYLAAISSFYSFAGEYPVPLLDGREVPLFDAINPARARGVPRPRNDAFAKATFLSGEEVDALLAAIETYRNSGPSRQAKGLRDYALIYTFLLTGGRNAEIRTLRWKDIRKEADGAVLYHWKNKGKEGWDELPPPAWQAIHRYLKLAGRLKTMKPDDAIFTAIGDSAARLPNAVTRRGEVATPLSPHEVGRILKFYGARAGIDPARLHVHTLRHTAYMLYTNGGSDVRFCSKLLHHSSLAITTRYDHVMSGQRNTDWMKAVSQLRNPGPLFTTSEDPE